MKTQVSVPVARYYDGKRVKTLAPMAKTNAAIAVSGYRRVTFLMGILLAAALTVIVMLTAG